MTQESLGYALTILEGLCIALVAVASYRRSRHLSRYPIWRSVLIAALAGLFYLLWLIVWWVNRERIAREWELVRAERASTAASKI